MMHGTTNIKNYNTQSSAPEVGQNNCPKHVELTWIINKPLLLYLVGCLFYLYQWWTVKQISDNEIYLLIKYIKSVLWRVAKRLSYIEDARCLNVKPQLIHTTNKFATQIAAIVEEWTFATSKIGSEGNFCCASWSWLILGWQLEKFI